jgi:hypothetical protein
MPEIKDVKNLDTELYELLKDKEIIKDQWGFFFLNKHTQKIHITGIRALTIENIKEILEKEKLKIIT